MHFINKRVLLTSALGQGHSLRILNLVIIHLKSQLLQFPMHEYTTFHKNFTI